MWNPDYVVLYCEDNPDDVFLTQRIFKKLGIPNRIVTVENGGEAIDYLSGRGKYGDRRSYPFPHAVITDLKMPRVDGFEILRWFLEHPDRALCSVIVWSSSEMRTDITRAYDLGAHCYLTKSADLENWEITIKGLLQFFEICEFPSVEK